MFEYSHMVESGTGRYIMEKAKLLRLMGHPTRLAIIRQLAEGPRCVTDIQELLDVPQANVSQHLAALRGMRVVDFHEDGNLRCYYIARPNVASFVLRILKDDYPIVEQSKDQVRNASKRAASEPCPAGELTCAGVVSSGKSAAALRFRAGKTQRKRGRR